MNTLGLIAARAGSKRISRKNIRPLAGKPLIEYAIRSGLLAKSITRLIVSTDDDEIAEVAVRAGAEVPFIRPKKYAEDDSTDQVVYLHALNMLQKLDGYRPDILVALRPTAPFRTPTLIDNVVTTLTENPSAELVRTLTKVESVHHPFWMYNLDHNNRTSQVIEKVDLEKYYQSQLLPAVFRLNGLVDALRPVIVEEDRLLKAANMVGFITPELQSVDIDTQLDFDYCGYLLEKRRPEFASLFI